MSIALFDPSIASENLGDQIIIDAVVRELTDIFPTEQLVHLPTQEVVSRRTFRLARAAERRFVGGTNLLSSHMTKYRQWQVGLLSTLFMKDITLLGVGWWQYQDKPGIYTSTVLSRILSKNVKHSVRDQYTKDQLGKIGIENVINTGCPTMWRLTDSHCKSILVKKSSRVVFTLTDYKRDVVNDRALISLLRELYETVTFWPQGSFDLSYLKTLTDVSGIEILPPTLAAFNENLARGEVDFVGTRLHGGVRALQRKRRALILAVDNRAVEISRDTGLPVVDRADLERVRIWILNPSSPPVTMNHAAIAQWKSQFA